MSENLQQVVSDQEAGQRLDLFCAALVPGTSRAALQRTIKAGRIMVNDEPSKPRYLVKAGDVVVISPLPRHSPVNDGAKAGLLPNIPILYEDQHIVAINKPPGLLVHAASNTAAPTVADWFAARYPTGLGYVHRLDRDTSGVLVLAKTPEAYEYLKEQFKKHTIKKEYLALVFGVPGGEDGRITRPLMRSARNPSRRTIVPPHARGGPARRTGGARGMPAVLAGGGSDLRGKPAITEWRIEAAFNRYALLRVFPFTGRTHQIRVHLHHIGHPIVGDALYVFKRQKPPAGVTRQLLHAETLTLRLLASPTGGPGSKKKIITAPLPADFQAVLDRLAK